MFTEFHGLSENPFTIMPNPRLAWLGAGVRKLRPELCKAVLEGRSLLVLSGVSGVGKSLALTLLASDLKNSGVPCRIHALNCGMQVSATDLLRRVAEGAGDDGAPTDALTVLLIDEAQHLGATELCALLHETALRGDRLRLVLAGTPELELAVSQALAEHPVVVATHCSLEPLRPAEIGCYVVGQLQAAGGGRHEIFTAGAIECLTRYSGGIPRRLNVLCSTALFLAWREGREDIDASIVEAALPAFNLRGSLPNADQLRQPAAVATSTRRPPIEAPALPESKDLPVAELESAVLDASAASATFDDVRSEVMESMSAWSAKSGSIAPQTDPPEAATCGAEAARLEIYEYATDVAVAAAPAPVSREIAQLQPKGVARLRRPVLVLIWEQVRRKRVLCVPLACAAAIVFLLVAIGWRARDEQPAGHAIAPTTLVAIQSADPPTNAATNKSTAVSVFVVPQVVEDEPPSAVEGQPPPQTIGPEELAKLLARARQQIEAFALTTPAGDNALETLQRVLAVMPTQPDALQGLREIAGRYAVLAAQAERRGEHSLAKRYVDKGLRVASDHPDLLAVQRKLAAQPY